jgi:hypothetical protein
VASRGLRGWTVVGTLVAVAVGWFGLAVSYLRILPFFGVLSWVTWLALVACWLWVGGVPTAAAVLLAGGGARWWAAWSVAVAMAAALASTVMGWPATTPGAQFRAHRADFAWIAAEYRAGRIGPDTELPWRLRPLSVDGRAHRQCRDDCLLYLPAWRDWRDEDGSGFAYFAVRPRIGTPVATAEGDVGTPERELGDGWWWVD